MIRSSAWIGSIAALFGLAVAGWLNAADDADNPRAGSKASTRAAARSDAGADSNAECDNMLVQCLIIDNEGEIALAEFAQQHTKNEEVKQFAAMMIEEHSSMLDKLRSAASDPHASGTTDAGIRLVAATEDDVRAEAGADDAATDNGATDDGATDDGATDDDARGDDADPNAADADAVGDDAAADVDADVDAGAGSNADPNADSGRERPRGNRADDLRDTTHANDAHSDHGVAAKMLQIKKELGEQCLKTTQSELSAKKGADFDKCYMTQQVMAHLHMIDTMTVYKNHASPAVQSLLDEGISTAQTHLTHAKDLCKKCEAQTGAKAKTAKRSAANQ